MAVREKKTSELDRLREYASMLSHNLKTPITGIKMMAEVLKEMEDPEDMQSVASDIYDATVRLQDFYRQMESVYRNVYMPPEPPENVSISRELEKVKMHLVAQIADTGAIISVDFDEGDTVFFRALSLNSILLNLLSNAIKYAKPGVPPKILVQTSNYTNEYLLLRVTDNGIGINLNKYGDKVFGLFEKFTDHPDATGMGLYITKNQVEAMGGDIWLESEPGIGSTFFLTLPLPR
ncbi:MAG: HAMP domain-containing histidine kinase [Cryomorphaceae bacterium]|nr:HAMP domain-containing histidine kinase [Cryomorphaceae bacterium]